MPGSLKSSSANSNAQPGFRAPGLGNKPLLSHKQQSLAEWEEGEREAGRQHGAPPPAQVPEAGALGAGIARWVWRLAPPFSGWPGTPGALGEAPTSKARQRPVEKQLSTIPRPQDPLPTSLAPGARAW